MQQRSWPRQFALVASTLGLCALFLAVTGLGGMVAFTVPQRLRDIGVRLALGARPLQIVHAIARQFTVPVACGAVAGSALAAGVGVVLSRELFGVSGLDPLAHGALLLFALVAAAAAAPSLRRAVRIDPIQTLRHEWTLLDSGATYSNGPAKAPSRVRMIYNTRCISRGGTKCKWRNGATAWRCVCPLPSSKRSISRKAIRSRSQSPANASSR